MSLDPDACYRAMLAHDERFDGRFFVAVKTTGIYCRPVCRVRMPARERCEFYTSAALAERAGYRACFRCRPELAPGLAPVDSVSRLVARAMRRIEAGALNEGSLEELARGLGVTGRHLRRAVQSELGLSPIDLAQTQRLALAKQLLHDTELPMTDVAFASGFRSLRRFNAAFKARYARSPSALRRQGRVSARPETVCVTLSYRPPLAWAALLEFLSLRAVPGVELVRDGVYYRTAEIGGAQGWLAVSACSDRPALRAELSFSLARHVLPLVARLRRLFDLDAEPWVIAEHLGKDRRLARSLRALPGLRVPGAFEAFEAACRAVLGQQVSVAAATTLAGRLARAYGLPLETPHPELARLTPRVERIADADAHELAALGITSARAQSLRRLAREMADGNLSLDQGSDAEATVARLQELPGIGAWTAEYVAMRALSWPDAFLEGDLGVRKALGSIDARAARALSEPWKPWRSYAVMHLWTHGT